MVQGGGPLFSDFREIVDAREEYKDFVEAVDVISIMQAKARRFLARQSA